MPKIKAPGAGAAKNECCLALAAKNRVLGVGTAKD